MSNRRMPDWTSHMMTDSLAAKLARPGEVHFWDANHRYVIGSYISTNVRGAKKGWIKVKTHSGRVLTIDPAKLRFPIK